MSTLRFTLAFLLIGGVLVASQAPVAGGGTDTYTLVIKKVEVKKTQKNGESWDVNNGEPDLRVIVRNMSDKDSKAFETKEHKDRFTADFNEPTNIKFKKGNILEFDVVDVDVAVNDTVGKTRIEMNDERLREGGLRLEGFEQVIYLEIQVKKL